jgi:hypothetical protein
MFGNAFKRLKRSSYKVDFNVTKQNKQNKTKIPLLIVGLHIST